MAASPDYKVTNERAQYIAAFKYAEDAARFVGGQDGYKVYRHRVRRVSLLWHEGAESFSAYESFDRAAAIMWAREEGHVPPPMAIR